jgi:hypothetical protein
VCTDNGFEIFSVEACTDSELQDTCVGATQLFKNCLNVILFRSLDTVACVCCLVHFI